MKRWIYFLAILPLGTGILIVILAVNHWISNPVIYLRGNLAPLAFLVGLILSAFIVTNLIFWSRYHQRHQREIQRIHEHASEDRRRFLYRLDHELKNPLTAIRAGLTNLNDEDLGEYLCNEVSAIKVQSLRINRLVADLRKLAALETTSLEKTVVDMAELLTEVVSMFENEAGLSDRKLTLILPNAPRPLPVVKGDPDLLLLAVHNLLDNAIKFTAPGDTIEVRASENSKEVIIEVADTGPGIPEKEAELVWEELYRSEHARGVPGSGLGLPMVRAIIEKHGGEVALRSIYGQGTVFSVQLPACN
jgi:two-component system OmpR family sensor kinase